MKIPVPTQIHLLVYAITVCGRGGKLPRRLQAMLESALGGAYSSSVQMHEPLPTEFYDFQYFSLDIDEELRKWIHG